MIHSQFDPAHRTVLLVLNYKKYSDTLNFLRSVIDCRIDDADIVILDNASGNDSVEEIRDWIESHFPDEGGKRIGTADVLLETCAPITHIHFVHVKGRVALFNSDRNLGFSGGNNALAAIGRQLGYDYIYLLNSDVIFTDTFAVSKMVELHKRAPDAYLSGPCIINRDGTFDSPFKRDSFWGDLVYYGPVNRLRRALGLPMMQFDLNALSKPDGAPVYKVSGAALFFPTERFFEIGSLDENVWLSSEEAILGEKIRALGGKVLYLPTTTLIHVKASAPRDQSRKVEILRNHFKQRNYYYRTYRNYGIVRMGLLRLGQKLRLLMANY